MVRRTRTLVVTAAMLTAIPTAARAADREPLTVGVGALTATVTPDPWRLRLTDPAGHEVLTEDDSRGSGADGALGLHTATGWAHATRVTDSRTTARGFTLTLATNDPQGRTLEVSLEGDREGVIALHARAQPTDGVDAVGMGFRATQDERFFGFGERSNAVDQRGHEVEHYVADGPFREEDRQYVRASSPPWATRDRDDATYFPIPWLLSSRGYGVLVDDDETSSHRLGIDRPDVWSVQTQAAHEDLRFFAGPQPADALRRFTAAVGRQPAPSAPWIFGPWFQTGQPNVVPLDDEARITRTLRDADVPVSAAETQMHYLPCGAQRGNEDYLRARNAAFHAAGLAHLAYFNPALCASYDPVFSRAAAAGVLQRDPSGLPFTYPAFVGGSGPLGFTQEPLAQFDFTAPNADAFYAGLIGEAVAAGHDGWLEDFGESTPPTAVSADGTPAAQMHNRYPTTYHCAVQRIARRQPRPIVRFQRSGWTHSAACADDVWGGDPTTVFGFDGLQSTVRQALSIGMSGVSRWGSDIGGYDSFGPAEQLTPELLTRWIEMGAVSGVMRTKRSGLAIPSYNRPQVFDPDILPVWRRYTKLHTELYPYLLGADAQYRETGLPLMRAFALTDPQDPRAVAVDDAFGFGDALIAAPVLDPGRQTRTLYLPRGRWVDWWRSVDYDQKGDGAFHLRRLKLLTGGQDVTLPAPREQLPLLMRMGALVAMLPADVDTLAPYGSEPGLVHLTDREDRLTVLAVPSGLSRARAFEQDRLSSRATRGRWRLRLRQTRRRAVHLEASTSGLRSATRRRAFVPCAVRVGRRALKHRAWRFDRSAQVLTATLSAQNATVTVVDRCGRSPSTGSDPSRPSAR